MKFLIICACVIAVCCAKKGDRPPKPPKQSRDVKAAVILCCAYNTSSLVDVTDPAFEDVFGEDVLGDFCDDLFDELNITSCSPPENPLDGMKFLKKVCRKVMKNLDKLAESPMAGFDAVCNASKDAAAMSLNDKGSRRALGGLRKMCRAQAAGSLTIRVDNFTVVFDDVVEFCELFLNETNAAKPVVERARAAVDGIKELGKVCRWFSKKFDDNMPEGSLALLEPICEDFSEIRKALSEDKPDSPERTEMGGDMQVDKILTNLEALMEQPAIRHSLFQAATELGREFFQQEIP